MEQKASALWDYFNKCISSDNQKRAQCIYCNNIYSYATTITNLKTHLVKKHGKNIDSLKHSIQKPPQSKTPAHAKPSSKKYWEHFTRDEDNEVAICNYCSNKYSYKSTLHNLAVHLFKMHPNVYEKYFQKVLNLDEITEEVYIDCDDDDQRTPATRSAPPIPNVAYYQDAESSDDSKVAEQLLASDDSATHCPVCHTRMRRQTLQSHLEKNHPEWDSTQLNGDSEVLLKDDGDIYTEVVYLENPESPQKPRVQSPRRPTLKFYRRNSRERRIKKQRKNSDSSSEERPRKIKSDDEIESFGNYITCLLKKMPNNVCRKLQRNIVNMIMNVDIETDSVQAVNSSEPNTVSVILNPVSSKSVPVTLGTFTSNSVPVTLEAVTSNSVPVTLPMTLQPATLSSLPNMTVLQQPVSTNFLVATKKENDIVINTSVTGSDSSGDHERQS